jgi:hypothetical protein
MPDTVLDFGKKVDDALKIENIIFKLSSNDCISVQTVPAEKEDNKR